MDSFDGDGQGGSFPTDRAAVTPSELARQAGTRLVTCRWEISREARRPVRFVTSR